MKKSIVNAVVASSFLALLSGCASFPNQEYEKSVYTSAISLDAIRDAIEQESDINTISIVSNVDEGIKLPEEPKQSEQVQVIKEPSVPTSNVKEVVKETKAPSGGNGTANLQTAPVSQAPQAPQAPVVVENEWDIVEFRDEQVWASAPLNIRTSPNVGAAEVAVANKGDKLHRVGICRNGWSQVEFFGQMRYCSTDYLSEKQVFRDMTIVSGDTKKGDSNNGIPECDGRLGDEGRLMIPDVGYSVALFNGSGMGEAYAQSLVDGWDSADYECNVGQSEYIADHNTDGFESMKSSVPGSTLAYIYWTDGSCTTYKCVAIHHNAKWRYNGGDSVDENGVPITKAGYDLVMQTCNSDDGSIITVSYWNKL